MIGRRTLTVSIVDYRMGHGVCPTMGMWMLGGSDIWPFLKLPHYIMEKFSPRTCHWSTSAFIELLRGLRAAERKIRLSTKLTLNHRRIFAKKMECLCILKQTSHVAYWKKYYPPCFSKKPWTPLKPWRRHLSGEFSRSRNLVGGLYLHSASIALLEDDYTRPARRGEPETMCQGALWGPLRLRAMRLELSCVNRTPHSFGISTWDDSVLITPYWSIRYTSPLPGFSCEFIRYCRGQEAVESKYWRENPQKFRKTQNRRFCIRKLSDYYNPEICVKLEWSQCYFACPGYRYRLRKKRNSISLSVTRIAPSRPTHMAYLKVTSAYGIRRIAEEEKRRSSAKSAITTVNEEVFKKLWIYNGISSSPDREEITTLIKGTRRLFPR